MIVKKFVVDKDDINGVSPVKVTVEIANPRNLTGNTYRPMEIIVVNETEADLGITYISSDEEDALRTSDVTLFAPIPLDSGKTSAKLPSIKYIYVTLLGGTATKDLDIYCVGYMP